MASAPSVRSGVAAEQEQQIASNIAKIEENRERAARPSALAVLASRLNISPGRLEGTLRNTVFKNSSDDEFAALVIVANEYGLNPLTKEMYAFPQKGGGIVPLVSIDGWIRIMNNHPQYDGIEFVDLPDDQGKLYAIEAVIHRKDRTRPIRVTEYLEECKGDTGPWKKSPARMLRHRALIQCARIAFGFSGIYDEEDSLIGEITLGGGNSAPPPMRSANRLTAPVDGDIYDPETGEVTRADTATADNPNAEEGRAEEDMGERQFDPQTGAEIDPNESIAEEIIELAKGLATIVDLKNLRVQRKAQIDAMSDELAGACTKAMRDAEERLTKK